MIGIKVEKLPGKVGEMKAALRKFSKRTIVRMSQYQRKIEQTSMKDAPKNVPSPAGTPPHTHARMSKKGNRMRAFPDFIRYDTNVGTSAEPRAVVGPTKRNKKLETIGKTHEFGGRSTVEKRVVYRPVRAGESGIWLDMGTTKGGKPRKKKLMRTSNMIPLFRKGGKEKVFNFTIHEQKYSGGKMFFKISYQATYPKRPFAAPALGKTIAATRQGKFG